MSSTPSRAPIDLTFERERRLRKRLQLFLQTPCPCCDYKYTIRAVAREVGGPLRYDNLYRFLKDRQFTMHPSKLNALEKWLTEREKRRGRITR